jgi:hypothetical protein
MAPPDLVGIENRSEIEISNLLIVASPRFLDLPPPGN